MATAMKTADNGTKTCGCCHARKPLAEFYAKRNKQRNNAIYYESYCKECENEYMRLLYMWKKGILKSKPTYYEMQKKAPRIRAKVAL